MAKPILVVHFPEPEDIKDVRDKVKDALYDEYHVLVVLGSKFDGVKIECFNDCKGLPDIDIEKMINELMGKK